MAIVEEVCYAFASGDDVLTSVITVSLWRGRLLMNDTVDDDAPNVICQSSLV